MTYVRDWEPLADALKRVIASGLSEDRAKSDICGAVADGKIAVRVTTAPSRSYRGGQVYSRGNVAVPAHLRAAHLDWVSSRPLKPWAIGPMPGQHYTWLGGWERYPIDLIELSTADVMRELCSAGNGETFPATAGQEIAAAKDLALHLKSNPQLTRAEAAELCKSYKVSTRGFQYRVWPKARVQAGLEARAPSGRKKKPSR